jgi:YVTN family beta-propeller protein
VANSSASSISVVSTPTRAIIATIPTGLFPTAVVVSFDGDHAYATSVIGSLLEIDTNTNTIRPYRAQRRPRPAFESPCCIETGEWVIRATGYRVPGYRL